MTLRNFGKKRVFRGWIKTRKKIRLYEYGNQKRYYRMTGRRVIQVISLIGVGYVLGNEEFVVGMGCFGGMWLVRAVTKVLFEKGTVIRAIRMVVGGGIVSIERCVVSIWKCMFEIMESRSRGMVLCEIEEEVLVLKYAK